MTHFLHSHINNILDQNTWVRFVSKNFNVQDVLDLYDWLEIKIVNSKASNLE